MNFSGPDCRTVVSLTCTATLLMVTIGCGPSAKAEIASGCKKWLQNEATALLLGSQGTNAVCRCTSDRLVERFPDATSRWEEYSASIEERLSQRGVLGMLADTSWQQSQGREMLEFAQAHGEITSACTAEWVEQVTKGANGQ